MNVQEQIDKVAQMPGKRGDVPTAPPIELVALVVRWARGLRNWKGHSPILPGFRSQR